MFQSASGRAPPSLNASIQFAIRSQLVPQLVLLVLLSFPLLLRAEVAAIPDPADDQTIASFVADMDRVGGFLPFYLDRREGRLYLLLQEFDQEMIYLHSLPQGVGSNDLGFDRGQIMDVEPALVRFEQAGTRVLLRRLNTRFRAVSTLAAERTAVEEAFASSVLWGFPVMAREDGGGVLVDATGFLLRDSHGIGRKLKAQKQGVYRVDDSRSALYYPRIKGFPRNTELEATVTFTGTDPGEFLQQVAPDPRSFSVRMHHSFVALPEPGYQPRTFLPDSGFWPFSYADYATSIDSELVRRFIPRHRLQKRDPAAAVSEPVQPIVYYLDPGTPEPVRSALLDGARWWNQAFEAAGYLNAFQVRMLPAAADPMDVRYNVIQWVHRATRGWSYGYGVHDPRTGEIIKGHVTLGSLRVRQDYLIAQGMTSPFVDPGSDTDALGAMALARIRQLSAHEVGHTLGLAHNFAASQADRASVMDYPQPVLTLTGNGEVSLAGAYAEGIGDWDKRAIRYGYADFGAFGKEGAALADFVEEGQQLGFRFISDPDARGIESMHPLASLWDNGSNAVTELKRVMALRRAALERFGEASIPFGRPYSSLEEVLVPVYFYHRYQVEAVGKWVGGADYNYGIRRPGQARAFRPIPAAAQRRALSVLLATLDAGWLELPPALRELIPPKAYGYERSRESPGGYTGLQLDPLSLAEAAAQHTLEVLLHPQRLARLGVQSAGDSDQLSISEVFDALFEQLFGAPLEGFTGAIQRRNGAALLAHWRRLATSTEAAPEVRAEAHGALQKAAMWLRRSSGESADYVSFHAFQLWLIEQFMARPGQLEPVNPRPMPPGSPIG
jgi:hypothetical protein